MPVSMLFSHPFQISRDLLAASGCLHRMSNQGRTLETMLVNEACDVLGHRRIVVSGMVW